MEKIKPLVADITNAYVDIGTTRSYLVNFSRRKELTANTQEITGGQMAAKLEEIISATNAIIEKLDNSFKKIS